MKREQTNWDETTTMKLYVMTNEMDGGALRKLGVEALCGKYQRGILSDDLFEKMKKCPSTEVGQSGDEFVRRIASLIDSVQVVDDVFINAVSTARDEHEPNGGNNVVRFLEEHRGSEVFMAPEVYKK